MTPTPPTLAQEAREFFREREDTTYKTYQNYLGSMVNASATCTVGEWHDAEDLRLDWELAHADWKRALATTPCTHRLVERQHTAQRCDYCWMISTYVRLSTPKEIEDDE